MKKPLELCGFVLTRGWRDGDDGLWLSYWLATPEGPLRLRLTGERAVMFVERDVPARADERKALPLTTPWAAPVDALYFRHQRALREEAERLRREGQLALEHDIKPSDRFLMERFVTAACRVSGQARERRGFREMHNPRVARADHTPRLREMSIDIETDGELGPIVSVAWVDAEGEGCLVVGRDVDSEKALLERFFATVRERDPDVFVGWNVVEFDLMHIQTRCDALGIGLSLGRGGERAAILPSQRPQQLPIARIPGRAVLDGIALLRAAFYSFESFSLEHVAGELLGRGKIIHDAEDRIDEIRRLWREDRDALAAYNLEDCRLVRDIFATTDLLAFAIARSEMTGLELSRVGGSVAAFDNLYLPRLHRHGHVAGEVTRLPDAAPSPGGYVLASQPGLYRNVLVLDFKSLYPSIIRTFKIDPMGMAFPGDDPIEGFDGARFNRDRHILPGLIEELWARRDEAKRRRDAPLSQATKILMNSFYGVLGTPACRFYSPRLASSITRRGHEIITRSRDWLIARDHRVIYGDTDSLFVLIGEGPDAAGCSAIGRDIADGINRWWRERLREEHRLESFLEMEFETHFERFFMPTLRGSDEGSAKRYAGLAGGEVIIKGLEAVRTDWTPLARRFQRELLERVFTDRPIEAWIREIRRALLAGELDEELVYHKRMRREAEEYQRNLPPHVRAARMLGRPVRSIRYVWTTRGPEPVEMQSSPIDHHHYLDKQLAPAADALLSSLGTSFEVIAGDQLRLF